MIKVDFVEFPTSDGLTLPGLLYRPKKSKKVIISLHGNGGSSVFYGETKKRKLAEVFAKKGISLFVFNNRGAHIIKELNIKKKDGEIERRRYGMAYEKIKDCVEDIEGTIMFLEKQGFRKFYLMGLSTGANKICVYNYYKPNNRISKYILLAGGDDTGIYYHMIGKTLFNKLLTRAKEKIKNNQGEEIITDPKLISSEIFSYSGFYDIGNPDGDYNCFPFYEVIHKEKLSTKPLFRYFKLINKPSLIIYGEKDEYVWGDVSRIINILKSYQPDLIYKIIKGADHSFTDHKEELARTVLNWIY
ncbi:MAG: DUF1749 domain-containing protein [FCB group bacterium]|nr:DUF1749 domain-containing protein [FCB group bacterium]